MNLKNILFAGVAAFAFVNQTSAAEIGEIQWHGFLTSAFLITSGAGKTDEDETVEYAEGISDHGGFKDTRFGLNVNVQIDSKWKLAAQLESLGEDDFEAEIDWAFASRALSDHSSLRFGKIKHPTGLVNDYADIGYSYLWIRPPDVFYNKASYGPNISYFAYTGASAILGTNFNDVNYSFDFHFGEVGMADGHASEWGGVKFEANYQEEVRFQLGINSGVMELDETSPRFATMYENRMTTSYVGLALDWDNLIFYTEAAYADHETMTVESGYATVGVPIGDYTTSFSYEQWNAGKGWGQKSVGLGLRVASSDSSVVKIEYKKIVLEQVPNLEGGRGLFEAVPENENVHLFGVALDVIF